MYELENRQRAEFPHTRINRQWSRRKNRASTPKSVAKRGRIVPRVKQLVQNKLVRAPKQPLAVADVHRTHGLPRVIMQIPAVKRYQGNNNRSVLSLTNVLFQGCCEQVRKLDHVMHSAKWHIYSLSTHTPYYTPIEAYTGCAFEARLPTLNFVKLVLSGKTSYFQLHVNNETTHAKTPKFT